MRRERMLTSLETDKHQLCPHDHTITMSRWFPRLFDCFGSCCFAERTGMIVVQIIVGNATTSSSNNCRKFRQTSW